MAIAETTMALRVSGAGSLDVHASTDVFEGRSGSMTAGMEEGLATALFAASQQCTDHTPGTFSIRQFRGEQTESNRFKLSGGAAVRILAA